MPPILDLAELAIDTIVTALEADSDIATLAPRGAHQDGFPQTTSTEPDRRAGILVEVQSDIPLDHHAGMFARDLSVQVKARTLITDGNTGSYLKSAILRVLNGLVLSITGYRAMYFRAKSGVHYLDPLTGGIRFRYDGWIFKLEVAV
jgi:hypothetical protein